MEFDFEGYDATERAPRVKRLEALTTGLTVASGVVLIIENCLQTEIKIHASEVADAVKKYSKLPDL